MTPDRSEDVVDALLAVRTKSEAEAALRRAAAYLADHPQDWQVIGACQSAETIRQAWDLPEAARWGPDWPHDG